MLKAFLPQFQGTLDLVEDVPDDFMNRVAARIDDGLIVRGNRRRSNYNVESLEPDAIHFRAADFWTALIIGLNDVELRRTGPRQLAYRVSYWTWTRYCVWLCAGIALVLVAAYLVFAPMMEHVRATSVGAAVFWGNVLFWGFAWPWILTALHKRPAARCLERILREELAEAQAQVAGQMDTVYRSSIEFFGLPFIHIGRGQGGPVRGIIAIGPFAQGVAAIGGQAHGVLAIGGVAIGGIAIGGVALGLAACGGVAMGVIAVGGVAWDIV